MTKNFLTLVFACWVVATSCSRPPGIGDGRKTIVIDKSEFSNVYPAVWFSPSTGELAPIWDKGTEVPPFEKYEIWIEPRDPELAFLKKDKGSKDCGFALLGNDSIQFEQPSIPADLKLERRVPRDWYKIENGPTVMYCKAKRIECLLMITAFDKNNEVLRLVWRPIQRH